MRTAEHQSLEHDEIIRNRIISKRRKKKVESKQLENESSSYIRIMYEEGTAISDSII